VFPLVDELTGRIRASLQLTDTSADRSISEVTTGSLEAYRLYSQGVEAHNALRLHDAWRLYREALEIDLSFAMAHFGLSQIAQWSELNLASQFPEPQGEMISSEEYLHKALEHVDRLPERQRLLVQAAVAAREGGREGDFDEAIALYEEIIALYPDEEDAYFRLTSIYPRDEPEKLLAVLERGMKAVPDSDTIHMLYGYMLLAVDRYTEAIRVFESYVELYPEEPNPYSSLAEGYLMSGQPEKALETLARGFEVNSSFELQLERTWAYAMLGRYGEALAEAAKIGGWIPETNRRLLQAFLLSRVGRYREAQEHMHQASELAEGLENPTGQVDVLLLSALLSLEGENYTESIEITSRAEDMLPRVSPPNRQEMGKALAHLLAGVAEARTGNLESARSHREALGKISASLIFKSGELQSFGQNTLDGEIALASGDLNGAEAAFTSAEPELKIAALPIMNPIQTALLHNLPFRDGLARVKKARGDLTGAVEIYRNLNTPGIRNKWTAMLEPRYVLEVARLLDETGDKEGARAEYERFLDLWKNADPERPELEEAKRYLEK
jgi:tetratricopeptide (TPR) repeat protein